MRRFVLLFAFGVVMLWIAVLRPAPAQATDGLGLFPAIYSEVVPGSVGVYYIGVSDAGFLPGETSVITLTMEDLAMSTATFTVSQPSLITRTIGFNNGLTLIENVYIPADTPEGAVNIKRFTVVDDDGITRTADLRIRVVKTWGISINGGALFTNSTSVSLTISVGGDPSNPLPVAMQISNDGGFVGAAWVPYTTTMQWQIEPYYNYVIPRHVYIRFFGFYQESVTRPYSDDIILDQSAPTGNVELGEGVANFSAQDDISGIASMRVSKIAQSGEWQPYTESIAWPAATPIYVIYRDRAGNVSRTYRDGPSAVYVPLLAH